MRTMRQKHRKLHNSLLFTSSAVIQKSSGGWHCVKSFVCLLEDKNPDGNLMQEQDFRMVSPGTGVYSPRARRTEGVYALLQDTLQRLAMVVLKSPHLSWILLQIVKHVFMARTL